MSYSKAHKWNFVVLFILTILISGIALVNPYLVKILIDDVLLSQNFDLFFLILLVFLGMFVVGSLINIALNYVSTKLTANLVLDVKKDLFEHLENLHLGFYHSKKVGDILSRLNDDVYGVEAFLKTVINEVLLDLLMGGFILAMCLKLNAKVTGVALLFAPFYIIVQKYFGKQVRKKRKKIRKKSADIMSFLQEDISEIKAIQSFAREKLELDKFKKKTKKLIGLDIEMSLLRGYSSMWVSFISFVPLFIILLYGGFNVMIGAMTIGTLMAIYTYIQKLFGPIGDLGNINIALQSSLVSVDRVFEFMDISPKIKDSPNAKTINSLNGKIDFKKVSFSYDGKKIIRNISFNIKPGEKIGIVGESGSGKSTIASLIPRFSDPDFGAVKLDGNNVKKIKINSLRNLIGAVGEDSGLFATTIKENIRFGKKDATQKEVERAAKLADAHDFIKKLPNGYDTIVGEKGATLSTGQKQRISLARTIVRNPDILILDEATSALDTKSTKRILKSLEDFAHDTTTIIISHNIPLLKKADRIFVLKDGKIAEKGTYSTLIKKKGIFYKMQKAGEFE
ncbi:MAG: ABC transporter ATP-binding protein [Candidatus Undinarchaeales archaeon]